MTRLVHLDWLRGVAVLVMVLWHTIDAWTLRSGRTGPAFQAIVFAAGWAAPLFLFLAGVSVALAGTARVDRGVTPDAAARALMRRGWYVFLLAHLFRLQSFLLNPNAVWSSILKPDILNILGLSIVAAAFLWARGTDLRSRAVWLLVPAALVVVLTPLSREWWWPTVLYPRFEAYIRPVGNFGVFTLFPFAGYVFAGAFLGEVLASRRHEDARLYRTLAVVGVGVAMAGAGGMAMGLSGTASTSASFAWRTGVMVFAVVLAWLIVRRRPPGRFSPLVVFGQTSLFVYWIHVELAYGVFSYPLRQALPLAWSLPAYISFTFLMLAAAVLWQRRPRGALIPVHMRAPSRLQAALERPK